MKEPPKKKKNQKLRTRSLKSRKRKTTYIQRKSRKMISRFFSRKCRLEGSNIFKVLKDKTTKQTNKNLPPRILYPEKLSFRIEVEIKFSRSTKAKGAHHHKTSLIRNVKGM